MLNLTDVDVIVSQIVAGRPAGMRVTMHTKFMKHPARIIPG